MEPAILVRNLNKSYGEVKAVNDVNITIPRGQVFGLLGANGAGKSTAIECILGTRKPNSGNVSILGMNPVSDRKVLFERVGVQFQESNYQDKITVTELCEVTHSLYKNAADYTELLRQFGLWEKRKSQVCELSGGQRQRLAVILAMISDPDVVFLDELTTGLDVQARRDVWKCLADKKEKGLTIFLTSHFMDEVEALCDQISILKNGSIVFNGTTREAIANSPYDKLEDAYLWFIGEEEIQDECI